MRTIYITTASGQQVSYDEEQMKTMLEQGLLNEDSLYWKEGMADWQPVRSLVIPLPRFPLPPPLPAQADSSPERYKFQKDPSGLTQTLKVMLWIQLALTVAGLFSDFGQMSLAASGHITREAAEANDARQGVIALLYLGSFIATAFIFMLWIHRANLNCRGFGAADMRFTPGWSIGYYFIPILTLFRPYQAMKEIWKVSSSPADWKNQPGSPLLGWWWALWLLSAFLGRVNFQMSQNVNSPSSLEDATAVSIAAAFVDISLLLVAICLISAIFAKQKRLTEKY